jgi:hypothetical protein
MAAHWISARIFGMTRTAAAHVDIEGSQVKICIAGEFGKFEGSMTRDTARQLGNELIEAADAKG